MPNVLSRPINLEWEEPDPAYDERKPIDKNLPPRHKVNLGEWLAMWTRLSESGNNHDRDTFALTGHYTDPDTGERRRAEIDLSGCRPKDADVIFQLSDIDSVIGIVPDDSDLPFRPGAILKYFMSLNVTHTLTTDLHIPPLKVAGLGDSTEDRRLHQIPNTRFLEMKPDGIVRIFFPHCELPCGGVCMDYDHMREFYDLAVYPAAEVALPEDLIREWPSTMADEQFRGTSRHKHGGAGGNIVQQTGRDVHASLLNPWIAEIRARVKDTPKLQWARNFFFAFEIRGTKNQVGSGHPPPEEPIATEDGDIDLGHPRAQAVEQLLCNFDTSQFQQGCWFLDLATRITISDDKDNPSACTFAVANMIAHLLAHFSGLSWEDCRKHTEGSTSRYSKDEVAHLNDIAGGRFTVSQSSDTGVFYIQIYTTDKSVTYNLALSHHAQRTNPRQIVNSFDSELNKFIDPLISAFRNSSGSHGVALRIESRVDFFSYPYVHLSIPEYLLRSCIYRLDRHVFWGWKMARLVSMRSVMLEWTAARQRFTLTQLPESGTLLLILVWMINSLVNRPDEGKRWDEVRDTACVHRMQGGQLVAARPLGAVFLPMIRYKKDKQPRVSSQRTLTIDTICYLMSTQGDRATESNLFALITGEGKKRPWEDNDPSSSNHTANVPRHSNKQRRVTIKTTERLENQFANIVPQLEREEYSSAEEDPEEREPTKDFGEMVTDLVASVPIQIIAKAPSRSGTGSWCSLTPRERLAIKPDFFCSLDALHEAFKDRVEFGADPEKWDRMVEMLFPDENNETKYQGLSNLGVRQDFQALLKRIPTNQRAKMVKYVRKYVSERWVWLPFGAPKGHLWATGKSPVYTTKVVDQYNDGPWFIFNPAFAN